LFRASVVVLILALLTAILVTHRSVSTREAVRHLSTSTAVGHRSASPPPARTRPAAHRAPSPRPRPPQQPRATRGKTLLVRPAHATSKTRRPKLTRPAVKKAARARAPKSAAFAPARLFTWPAQEGATGYVVRFFRNGRRVALLQAKKPRVALPPSFRFRAGNYRWQVFPVVAGRLGRPVVDSAFALPGG
jgi:hypothetical protein